MRKNIRKNILLTDHICAILENPEELKKLNPQRRAVFLFEQRNKIQDTIEYLTFMLEHLPEKQLKQVFAEKTMRPFLKALFHHESENHERILSLLNILFSDIFTETYCGQLIGREKWQMLMWKIPSRLQAIYWAIMSE